MTRTFECTVFTSICLLFSIHSLPAQEAPPGAHWHDTGVLSSVTLESLGAATIDGEEQSSRLEHQHTLVRTNESSKFVEILDPMAGTVQTLRHVTPKSFDEWNLELVGTEAKPITIAGRSFNATVKSYQLKPGKESVYVGGGPSPKILQMLNGKDVITSRHVTLQLWEVETLDVPYRETEFLDHYLPLGSTAVAFKLRTDSKSSEGKVIERVDTEGKTKTVEALQIDGKRVRCYVFETTKKQSGLDRDGKMAVSETSVKKEWISNDIPGRSAKLIEKGTVNGVEATLTTKATSFVVDDYTPPDFTKPEARAVIGPGHWPWTGSQVGNWRFEVTTAYENKAKIGGRMTYLQPMRATPEALVMSYVPVSGMRLKMDEASLQRHSVPTKGKVLKQGDGKVNIGGKAYPAKLLFRRGEDRAQTCKWMLDDPALSWPTLNAKGGLLRRYSQEHLPDGTKVVVQSWFERDRYVDTEGARADVWFDWVEKNKEGATETSLKCEVWKGPNFLGSIVKDGDLRVVTYVQSEGGPSDRVVIIPPEIQISSALKRATLSKLLTGNEETFTRLREERARIENSFPSK